MSGKRVSNSVKRVELTVELESGDRFVLSVPETAIFELGEYAAEFLAVIGGPQREADAPVADLGDIEDDVDRVATALHGRVREWSNREAVEGSLRSVLAELGLAVAPRVAPTKVAAVIPRELDGGELEALGTYNSERHRGLVHTDDYKKAMRTLQRRFDLTRARTR